MDLPHAIDPKHPAGYGGLTSPYEHFKFRWDIERSMRDSVKVIEETEKDFATRFGRKYGFTDDYLCDDADVVVVSMGTLGKEAEVAIDISVKKVSGQVLCDCAAAPVPKTQSQRKGNRRYRSRLLIWLWGYTRNINPGTAEN